MSGLAASVYSTDTAKSGDALHSKEKDFVLKHGPCRPVVDFRRDSTGPNKDHGFSAARYEQNSKAGIKCDI